MDNLHRRKVVQSLLGLAFTGCQPTEERFPIGEILGPNVAVGHRISDGIISNVEEWSTVEVLIIGAGVAGLAAGWELLHQGIDQFLILELESQIGGTSQSGIANRVPYPWGAHYLPVPLEDPSDANNQRIWDLLGEMGVVEEILDDGTHVISEQFLCRDPEERVFYGGRWYEGLYLSAGASLEDQKQWERFHREIDHWVTWRDREGKRAFSSPIVNSSTEPAARHLDEMTFSAWLKREGYDSGRLLWWIEYACRDDYGAGLAEVSAWAGLYYFASRLQKSGSDPQALITWPEGNGRIVNHFRDRLGDRVLPSQPVSSIRLKSEQRAQLEVISGSRGYRASQVIYAGPSFLLRYLLDRDDRVQIPETSKWEYSPWLVANLHLKGRPKSAGFPLAWDNVLYDSPSLGYVCATHQLGIDYGPTILTYYYPFWQAPSRESRQMLLDMNWEDCAELVLEDLRKPHPELRSLCERLNVMRFGHGMIRPTPGFLSDSSRRDALKPIGGLIRAHTDLSGIALFEEAFYHGCRAARETASIRKKGVS